MTCIWVRYMLYHYKYMWVNSLGIGGVGGVGGWVNILS